jgi:hypothetical protein
MLGDSGERHPSRVQVQEEQNIVSDQAASGEHFDGEEIDTCDDGHVRANKHLQLIC